MTYRDRADVRYERARRLDVMRVYRMRGDERIFVGWVKRRQLGITHPAVAALGEGETSGFVFLPRSPGRGWGEPGPTCRTRDDAYERWRKPR